MSANANDAWSDLSESVSEDFDRLSERQVQFAETELNKGHPVFPLAALLLHDGSFDVIDSHVATSIRVALDELWTKCTQGAVSSARLESSPN